MVIKMKVSILGTEYTVLFDVDEKNMPEGADGCIDQSIKQIKIAKLVSDKNSLQDLKEYQKKVLRHEIIHAFFYESGLWNQSGYSEAWGIDERITDWFAIQSLKIFEAFKAVGCI